MKQQGDQISDATLRKLGSEGIDSVQLNEYSKDKKLVLIGVPGAFTPTCSVNHVPGFIDKADEILAKGVDEIICISVTNPWVMDAWGKNLNADKITMLSDGNCEFTESMGLIMDGSGFGLGKVSSRYAAIVEDGKINCLLAEKGGAFEVSSAETVSYTHLTLPTTVFV